MQSATWCGDPDSIVGSDFPTESIVLACILGQLALDRQVPGIGSAVAFCRSMSVVQKAKRRMPTSEEIDDGWGLVEERGQLSLHSVPAEAPETIYAAEEATIMGWSLAEEAESRVPAVRALSAVMNPVSEEDLAFFSRADLAEGTEVDFPVPSEHWFEDLRCIVPRNRPASVSDSGPIPSRSIAPALEAVEADVESELPFSLEPAADTMATKKVSWWKRLRRSKG